MVRDKGNDFEPANGESGWAEDGTSHPPTLGGRLFEKHEELLIPKEEEELALSDEGGFDISEDDQRLPEEEFVRSARPGKAESSIPDAFKPVAAVPPRISSAKLFPAASARPATLRRGGRDAVEQLWASVFFSPDHLAPKTVVVTAAESREGVSQIAVALALVGCAAERGLRIALVDFNLRRPMLHKILDLQPIPGVTEVLAGQTTLASAIQPIEEGRLHVLAAGQVQGVAPSLVQRQNVSTLIRDLAAAYDHVIVDAPPVSTQATVQALAGCADGVLLVANASVTRREAVAEARKRIELAHGSVIGLVLNQWRFPIPGFLDRRM
ncbi:MAG: CpsD/CapB family tyrosine-protein kinase [Phycisphaerales bacterium]|nr:CpsD/CapB family tyrosine-protein kinase [Phycisphaerales bacterium]